MSDHEAAMAHLISFTTARFDVSKETPNRFNPFAGQSVLEWLRPQLAEAGCTTTEPDTEDWGWYMDVQCAGGSYMVGASGDAEADTPEIDWVIQIERHRSLTDRMFGRHVMADDDSLVAAIEKMVRADGQMVNVSVEREG